MVLFEKEIISWKEISNFMKTWSGFQKKLQGKYTEGRNCRVASDFCTGTQISGKKRRKTVGIRFPFTTDYFILLINFFWMRWKMDKRMERWESHDQNFILERGYLNQLENQINDENNDINDDKSLFTTEQNHTFILYQKTNNKKKKKINNKMNKIKIY